VVDERNPPAAQIDYTWMDMVDGVAVVERGVLCAVQGLSQYWGKRSTRLQCRATTQLNSFRLSHIGRILEIAMAKVARSSRGGSKKGERRGGRVKGTPNKITAAFKTTVLTVYGRMGGDDTLLAWAAENQTEFYKICARLIPHEVIGAGEDGSHVIKTIVHEHYPSPPASK
jgi:hypothetical protein